MARVLLVDDDAAALDLRKIILEREGHQVSMASEPSSARALFAEAQPDSVVLDLRLPEAKEGLALIHDFRARAPGVRIIVLAGWPLDIEGTPEAQMVNLILAKPIRTAVLIDALAELEPGRA
jgi:two-component system response regulator RegA